MWASWAISISDFGFLCWSCTVFSMLKTILSSVTTLKASNQGVDGTKYDVLSGNANSRRADQSTCQCTRISDFRMSVSSGVVAQFMAIIATADTSAGIAAV